MDDRTQQPPLLSLWHALSKELSAEGMGIHSSPVRPVLRRFYAGAQQILQSKTRPGQCRRATFWEVLTCDTHEPGCSSHCGPGCGCDVP